MVNASEKRVVMSPVLRLADVYKRQVEAILKQEPDYGRVFDDSVKFDGTLDEINYQIILEVLHEEHDNRCV